MIVIPHHLYEKLVANGKDADGTDHVTVVKFFDPAGAATGLITEIRAADQDTMFGLCDLGVGYPELGYVSLGELKSIRNRLGIPLERDLFFTARFPLSVYAEAARRAERITESETDLVEAEKALAQEASSDAKQSPIQ